MKRLLMALMVALTLCGCASAADWNKPALTDTYTNFLTYLDARLDDVATGFVNAPTNPPTWTMRFNISTSKWERWNGSAWVDVASVYAISVSGNAATATNVAWSGITSKPTTTSGYGITDYTAADVLTKIKTVDGAGSGLDADLLGGSGAAAYPKTVSESSLKIVRAQVNGTTAAVTYGSGVTATRTSAGLYTISFSSAFSAQPVVVASALNLGSVVTNVYYNTDHWEVHCRTTGGAYADSTFTLIAIGPI